MCVLGLSCDDPCFFFSGQILIRDEHMNNHVKLTNDDQIITAGYGYGYGYWGKEIKQPKKNKEEKEKEKRKMVMMMKQSITQKQKTSSCGQIVILMSGKIWNSSSQMVD